MKRLAWIALALFLVLAAGRAQDQQAQPVANPVSSNIKQQLARYSKIMVAAADSMPADKFNYSPTPQQMTFAHLTAHIATSNTFLCSKISGTLPRPIRSLRTQTRKTNWWRAYKLRSITARRRSRRWTIQSWPAGRVVRQSPQYHRGSDDLNHQRLGRSLQHAGGLFALKRHTSADCATPRPAK
jgi:hypothetical protein